jgi:hypothetical protein
MSSETYEYMLYITLLAPAALRWLLEKVKVKLALEQAQMGGGEEGRVIAVLFL